MNSSKSKRILGPDYLFPRDAIKADNAEFLAGRTALIRETVNALTSRTQSCVIFGDRGVGKTTVGWQVATILDGSNTFFKRDDFMRIDSQVKFKCAFTKVGTAINKLHHFLLHLLRPNNDPFSLRKLFPDVYSDRSYLTDVKARFKIDLLSLATFEVGAEHGDQPAVNRTETYKELLPESLAALLFQDVLQEINNREPETRLVVFVDEADYLVHADGVGAFLKNVDHAQFVFIGVGDTVSQIIKDHRSAGRRLTGGDFRVPGLSEEEIRWIYDKATKQSGETLHVEPDFVDLIVQYSAGFPWIAQNVGHLALRSKLLSVPEGDEVALVRQDFKDAFKQVQRIYEEEFGVSVKFSVATKFPVYSRICSLIMASSQALNEGDVRSVAENEDKRHVSTVLRDLVDAHILRRAENGFYRFDDPVVRAMTKGAIEAATSEDESK